MGTELVKSIEEISRREGFYDCADKMMNFINSLDTADMTVEEVRSAMYKFAMEVRPDNQVTW